MDRHEKSLGLVSIIVPALNEAGAIVSTLEPLQPMRSMGHEVIVVDGGSADDTVALASPMADAVISSCRGRGIQMNTGAGLAKGEVLLFLHADTRLPGGALQLIVDGLSSTGKSWGRFDVRLSGSRILLRVVERMMNWRSRLTGIATGDQAMFVRHEVFQAVGNFPDIALMEDIALSRTLKRTGGAPLCLSTPVVTSSRRWEESGILRTMLLMWQLRLAYFLGASPARLERRYTRREVSHERA